MVNTDDCWLYAGEISKTGYAALRFYRQGVHVNVRFHRTMYENFVGEIPEGTVIDHLCSVRRCINPSHLEAVTQAENLRRGNRPSPYGTHCNKGHDLSHVGYRVNKKGSKMCKQCIRDYRKRYSTALRAD